MASNNISVEETDEQKSKSFTQHHTLIRAQLIPDLHQSYPRAHTKNNNGDDDDCDNSN